jgi:hypothetical protein
MFPTLQTLQELHRDHAITHLSVANSCSAGSLKGSLEEMHAEAQKMFNEEDEQIHVIMHCKRGIVLIAEKAPRLPAEQRRRVINAYRGDIKMSIHPDWDGPRTCDICEEVSFSTSTFNRNKHACGPCRSLLYLRAEFV